MCLLITGKCTCLLTNGACFSLSYLVCTYSCTLVTCLGTEKIIFIKMASVTHKHTHAHTRTYWQWIKWLLFTHSFIHSFGTCRMRLFIAVLRSFFHSSLLCTFSCHPSPPTILPSSLTSSCHLFLGHPLNVVVPKFIYNTLLAILFPSILCTCPNQRNLFKLIVSIIVGFCNHCMNYLLVNILQFSFSLSYTGPKILLYTFLSKM